ncbi:probable aspartyl aminopeptidase isoform X1 [Alnus glutinosa]|uniref:probable aspartyl aminopeptidase isoform X1 n=1 Tax=Alnus glutinosa TaxID=3517 RepID=UPI002D79174E|nr:probable aspartyl aminopeptidase isoform X1 [Alnus glutinosa]XP_062174181.1 probable aspartyl aminopeptidase isoform X1 [Alnus glutinosa]
MAAITRLRLLHHSSPTLKPSLLLSKCPHSPSHSFNTNLRRKFSATPLCSNSVSTHQSSSSADGSGGSIVGDLLDYLNESWTHFHATAEAKRQLIAAGFHLLNENDEWDLKPGGRYFFTRNMSCLVAFAIGEKYAVGNGFHVIAAHTDSPCLKLKPKSASSKSGYLMVNVQTYGGGLWHTWFDRDLSVAGRVIVRGSDGSFMHKLVKVKRPLLRIPTLAIHLDRTVNKDGFKPNLETHLIPLLSTKLEETLESKEKSTASSLKPAHHPLLMQALSDELNCGIHDIVSVELNICDTQPGCLGGGNDEFIFSGRLDNLASSYCALRALIDSCKLASDLSSEHAIRMVALFDNEEVGSDSVQGAGAPTMFQAMRRIVSCLVNEYVGEGAFERAIRHSFLVSADMAHGVHPNFMDKHEEHHRPEMQKGLVIKHNANQRYATSGVTAFLFKEVGKIHNLPTQEFVVRNDMGCGSTIGPILASGVGIRTVDCGIAQLSMHSVREICGKEDIDIAYKHFKAFYQTFSSIDRKLKVDF